MKLYSNEIMERRIEITWIRTNCTCYHWIVRHTVSLSHSGQAPRHYQMIRWPLAFTRGAFGKCSKLLRSNPKSSTQPFWQQPYHCSPSWVCTCLFAFVLLIGFGVRDRGFDDWIHHLVLLVILDIHLLVLNLLALEGLVPYWLHLKESLDMNRNIKCRAGLESGWTKKN